MNLQLYTSDPIKRSSIPVVNGFRHPFTSDVSQYSATAANNNFRRHPPATPSSINFSGSTDSQSMIRSWNPSRNTRVILSPIVDVSPGAENPNISSQFGAIQRKHRFLSESARCLYNPECFGNGVEVDETNFDNNSLTTSDEAVRAANNIMQQNLENQNSKSDFDMLEEVVSPNNGSLKRSPGMFLNPHAAVKEGLGAIVYASDTDVSNIKGVNGVINFRASVTTDITNCSTPAGDESVFSDDVMSTALLFEGLNRGLFNQISSIPCSNQSSRTSVASTGMNSFTINQQPPKLRRSKSLPSNFAKLEMKRLRFVPKLELYRCPEFILNNKKVFNDHVDKSKASKLNTTVEVLQNSSTKQINWNKDPEFDYQSDGYYEGTNNDRNRKTMLPNNVERKLSNNGNNANNIGYNNNNKDNEGTDQNCSNNKNYNKKINTDAKKNQAFHRVNNNGISLSNQFQHRNFLLGLKNMYIKHDEVCKTVSSEVAAATATTTQDASSTTREGLHKGDKVDTVQRSVQTQTKSPKKPATLQQELPVSFPSYWNGGAININTIKTLNRENAAIQSPVKTPTRNLMQQRRPPRHIRQSEKMVIISSGYSTSHLHQIYPETMSPNAKISSISLGHHGSFRDDVNSSASSPGQINGSPLSRGPSNASSLLCRRHPRHYRSVSSGASATNKIRFAWQDGGYVSSLSARPGTINCDAN